VTFPSLLLAQVETVYPAEGEVSVVLKHLGLLDGVRIRVLFDHASARSGRFLLPQPGDWGHVEMNQDHGRSGVWAGTLTDSLWHALPLEVLAKDPLALVNLYRDGMYQIHFSNGDRETQMPDGTLLRRTHSKDGSVSNTTGRAKRTPLKVSEDDGHGNAVRKTYAPPKQPPPDIEVEHSSGAVLRLTADGEFFLSTPKGHTFVLRDDTEKARSTSGSVTSQPGEDAGRRESGVELVSEMGHRVHLHDDPVNATSRALTLTSAGGHMVTLQDKPVSEIAAITVGGLSLILNDATQTATVHGETVVVDGNLIKLGINATKRVVLNGDLDTGGFSSISTAVKVLAE
jgi:hypothetical protein